MGHREQKVEKRRRHVKGVACANDGDVTLEGRLEREVQGEVTLVDPGALIHDSFTLEPAELQSDIGRMFHGHVGSCCNSGDCLKVLAHQTVPRPRIRRVHH